MSLSSAPSRLRRAAPPLDCAALERLALRYVERFATTRAKLADYLRRKVRERGWDGPPGDPVALAERMAGLGYIDDRAFGEARAAALTRRGFGARRITGALRHAGIEDDDRSAIVAGVASRQGESAIAFARRKRIGPYAAAPPDRAAREKQIAQLLRAGHDLDLARRLVAMAPGEDPEQVLAR